MNRRFLPLVGALTLAACHAERRSDGAPRWTGQRFELRSSSPLAIAGALAGRAVEVRLEVARALSMGTEACFPAAEKQRRVVRVPLAAGGFESSEEAELSPLTLGGITLEGRRMAKRPEPGPCVVTLGQDLLGNQAVRVDWAEHWLEFVPSRPEASFVGPQVVELSRDPKSDLLLMPVGLRGPGGATVVPLVVSLGLRSSVLSEAVSRRVGVPEGGAKLTALAVELVPGVEVSGVEAQSFKGWKNPEAAGVLGVDVWRGTRLVMDVPALRMVLERLPASSAPPPARAPSAAPDEADEGGVEP